MARTADTDLPRRRKKCGKRLREAIELKGLTPKPFLIRMKEAHGIEDENSEDGYYLPGLNSLGTLSRIMAGKLTLKNNHARWAADILGIDVNYLLGTYDDFEADTYDQYLKLINERKATAEELSEANIYYALFKYLGYELEDMSPGESGYFSISRQGRSAMVKKSEMRDILQNAKLFINGRLEIILDHQSTPIYENQK